jgi:hypothetical protein
VKPQRLFHISEESNIRAFNPRPSPTHFDNLTGDVVFAITDMLLHNYILPRDCPRVTYYKKQDTSQHDKDKFFGSSTANFVISVENEWYRKIRETTLYCYELPSDSFIELDQSAGYYISYNSVIPVAMRQIDDLLEELLLRKIEVRFLPTLRKLAEDVSKSTLEFSLIRMRNANQQC